MTFLFLLHFFSNRELRKRRGLSEEKLADLAHLDPKHLQIIESGRVNTTLASLVGIGRALGVPLRELFEGV